MAHTKAPWRAVDTDVLLPNSAGGFSVRNCPDPETLAKFIVKAANCHDELLEALIFVWEWMDKTGKIQPPVPPLRNTGSITGLMTTVEAKDRLLSIIKEATGETP